MKTFFSKAATIGLAVFAAAALGMSCMSCASCGGQQAYATDGAETTPFEDRFLSFGSDSLFLAADSWADFSGKSGFVRLSLGGLTQDVSVDELQTMAKARFRDVPGTMHIAKDFTFQQGASGTRFAGLSFNLHLPAGNSAADKAVRKQIYANIAYDAFATSDTDVAPFANLDASAAQQMADYYGKLWERREGFALVRSYRVADNALFSTYLYSSTNHYGGAHSFTSSYQFSVRKRDGKLLSIEDIVRRERLEDFREVVTDELRRMYCQRNELREDTPLDSTAMELPQKPCIRFEDGRRSLSDDGTDLGLDTSEALPPGKLALQHVALMPNGVVVTYHPYEVDCFANGEYHVLVPFARLKGMLTADFAQAAAAERVNPWAFFSDKLISLTE